VTYQEYCDVDLSPKGGPELLLLHTTNRKYHMAYLFVSYPMTLDDLEGHSRNAGLIKCNSTNIYATFNRLLTDTARRAVPRR